MNLEKLSDLARSLTPDDDPDLGEDLYPYFEKIRRALGARSDDITELLDRWLRHSLYEIELVDSVDDLCIDVAHIMLLSYLTGGLVGDSPPRSHKGLAKANWNAAIGISLAYRENFKGKPSFENDVTRRDYPRYRNAARSARRLGAKVVLKNGDLRIERYDDLVSTVLQSVEALGGINLLPIIVANLESYYSDEFDRYIIPRLVGSSQNHREPSYPWGLLYNLSLASVNAKELTEPDKASVKETFEMARNLVSMWTIEPYSPHGQASDDVDSLFDVLQQAFAFDETISIRQANFHNVKMLCDACFEEEVVESALGVDLAQLNAFFEFIEVAAGETHGCTLIHQKVAEAELSKSGIDKCSFKNLLEIFCTNDSKEIAWKPMTRFRQALYLPDIRTSAEKFFTAVARTASNSNRRFDTIIGRNFEDHILELLRFHGVEFAHGKFSFPGGEGESDAIVETADSILLLEIKKRGLAPESRFGSVDRLFRDLMHGLFYSQVQAARVENALHRYGRLQLASGNVIELRGRQVERISIVPFSYGILHYRRIREDALRLLSTISATYKRGSLDMSKYGNLLKYALKRQSQVRELRELGVSAVEAPDFRSHLLDYDMLRYLVRDVEDNESFGRVVLDGSNVEFSTFDWWAERRQFEQIRTSPFGQNTHAAS